MADAPKAAGGFARLPRVVRGLALLGCIATSTCAVAQQAQGSLSISTKELPQATLWNPYSAQLEAGGGIEPYHWRIISGHLPEGFELRDSGQIIGIVSQQGEAMFTVEVKDRGGEHTKSVTLTLGVEPPLKTAWLRKSQVNGARIEGSVKVSNTTGRDFDLTFVVLAVNDVGRATAIGYQHFPLKRNTRDLELPFGDTLPSGDYTVNVDLVGEEPMSKNIFRTRLVTPKQTVAQSQ